MTDTDKDAATSDSAASTPGPSAPQSDSLRGAKIRLFLAATAFLAWMGYLIFLASSAGRPTVVSRPQLLASQLDVVVVIDAKEDGSPDPRVVIDEHLWSLDDQVKPNSKTIQIINLSQATGWQGPGVYFVPLVARGEAYSIAPVAPSPGYHGQNDLRIYKATDEVLRQARTFRR
ncbi:MAG: hypothetical protein AB7K24_26100 [Gemmataceae bacterium]